MSWIVFAVIVHNGLGLLFIYYFNLKLMYILSSSYILAFSNCFLVPRPEQAKPKPKPVAQGIPSTRYNELLRIIEELGKDVKPTYAGSKNAAERLRKGMVFEQYLGTKHLIFLTFLIFLHRDTSCKSLSS